MPSSGKPWSLGPWGMLGTSPAKGFPAEESFCLRERSFTSALLPKPRDVQRASLVLVMGG